MAAQFTGYRWDSPGLVPASGAPHSPLVSFAAIVMIFTAAPLQKPEVHAER